MDRLLDECLPHRWELNFDHYAKPVLAALVRSVRRLGSTMGRAGVDVADHHHIVLYDYAKLDGTMGMLSADDDAGGFGVPPLPGTNASLNSVRPEESCRDEEAMLKKFHDCFTDRLADLH